MKPMTAQFGGQTDISDFFSAFEGAHRIDAEFESFEKTDVLQYRGRPQASFGAGHPYDAEAARRKACLIAAE